jgi:predicted ATPase
VSECYAFVHALYHEMVYSRLTATRRLRLHRRIGQRLEAGYGERARDIAPELAMHFEQGREYGRAVVYRRYAAEQAIQRGAYRAAISHLTRGLEVLKALPDTHDRARLELDIQSMLGPALIAIKGNAAPEVHRAYTRARMLCLQVGDTPQLFPILFGLARYHLVRRELQTTWDLATQCLALAQQENDPELLLRAHWALGATCFYQGAFVTARAHLEHAAVFTMAARHHPTILSAEPDFRVACCSFAGLTLWMLGYPDAALHQAYEGILLAQDPSHPYSLAYILSWGAVLRQLRREEKATWKWAEQLIALATEQGFDFLVAMGMILRGWSLAAQGELKEGIIQMRQGIAAWQATGADAPRSWYLAPLGEIYGKAGQTMEGLGVVNEALAAITTTGEHAWEAELHRLKGELLVQESSNHKAKVKRKTLLEAERWLCRALDIASSQQAKSLELRAAVSLSRLWQQQGKRAEARQLLTEVYGWFTEGFDTADLQEAKALLGELER